MLDCRAGALHPAAGAEGCASNPGVAGRLRRGQDDAPAGQPTADIQHDFRATNPRRAGRGCRCRPNAHDRPGVAGRSHRPCTLRGSGVRTHRGRLCAVARERASTSLPLWTPARSAGPLDGRDRLLRSTAYARVDAA